MERDVPFSAVQVQRTVMWKANAQGVLFSGLSKNVPNCPISTRSLKMNIHKIKSNKILKFHHISTFINFIVFEKIVQNCNFKKIKTFSFRYISLSI